MGKENEAFSYEPELRAAASAHESDRCPATSPSLRLDEARCAALMRVLTSIVWVSDAEGRFVEPQPSWTDYTGQTWAEQQGFGWMQVVHPEDLPRVRESIESAKSSRTLYSASLRLWHASSHGWRHVEARGVPIAGEDGGVHEWIGTCRDVDERKKAEDVLLRTDRRKDEFIAILSHELRNPLMPIRNAVQVLKLRGNSDMQLTWARNVIERQVTQMAHLLEDLLDLSRIGQNKLELHKLWVTLDSILDAAIEVSRPLCEQAGHRLELNALSEPIHLEADSHRLVQAFTNLLNNAVKYTERGGRITLTVRREPGVAVVEIEDTGIGIGPEMLPRIFDLFTQDRPALERSQGGLGIGLSIVKALVEMHGGTVDAFSAGPRLGSSFTVRLPAADRRSLAVTREAPRSAPSRSLKILVADDNADAAESLSVLLEMVGHDVHVAGDGEEALEVARAVRPDVALLDIGMPKLNGYELARQLRAGHPRNPVLVAITGWGQRDDLRRAAEAGFDFHLVKPVDPDELIRLIARITDVPQLD
jgi:PAS domain S-box-containing protein